VKHFNNKSVLVTGAGGSIGSEICRRIAMAKVRRLTLVSLTESGLYRIDRQLRSMNASVEIRPVLGSVFDHDLMREVTRDVDIVVHAAAHKHIPLCEQNPVEAVLNNVGGTLSLMQASSESQVTQFVLISTDKAVRPTSVMGMTKRAAELLVKRWSHKGSRTRFFAVRFGNVMNSDGSVLPLWREQIAAGGPVTLTDERCERYFMSISQASQLVLDVVSMRPKSGTFVFDMGAPLKLIDMAKQLIGDREVRIEVTGLRPGEKLTEELHFGGDLNPTQVPGVMSVDEPDIDDVVARMDLRALVDAARSRNRDVTLAKLREVTR
jgi:FlaA1/EpsC-like NDP-sugar epimerase